ncbi:MAG: hypothetical protein IH986_04870 [Planctomycetes bacterium]|nr:hypothetical protein [Planctomycetota bacterium]
MTSRETGVLAAIGSTSVRVWRRPRVAIISTGDEIIAPGESLAPGMVYDSNAQILADAVAELGGEPLPLGIVRDDLNRLRVAVHGALAVADVVLLSGGTSKGSGDLSYRVVAELDVTAIEDVDDECQSRPDGRQRARGAAKAGQHQGRVEGERGEGIHRHPHRAISIARARDDGNPCREPAQRLAILYGSNFHADPYNLPLSE